MENRINNDFFEELLREATEHFTMQPSRRVWTSIYNNFHPSRKWPSFSSSLFIAFIIFLTGYYNVSLIDHNPKNPFDSKQKFLSNVIVMKNQPALAEKKSMALIIPSSIQFQKGTITTAVTSQKEITSHSKINLNQQAIHRMSLIPGEIAEDSITHDNTLDLNTAVINSDNKKSSHINADLLKDLVKQPESPVFFQFYATPSYGYRFMNRNNSDIITQSSFISNAGPVEEVFDLQQSPALNLEAGGTVLFPVNKDFRIKAGMQFNYTNYKVLGEQLPYPFYSNMQLNAAGGGSSLEAHMSEVSNMSNLSTGGELFNNNTYQISLPVGTDFKLMGDGQLRWYAGATIQPSYLMASSPYLITADMKNYVNDPAFVRKWNINTSFETFITYQIKGGTILNAGPQIRYQVFSTYNSKYIYDERLYNIGIKLGITPRF